MYLEQMPDREGSKFFRGKRFDPTVFEKVGMRIFALSGTNR
jgi:hypothetical protein